MFKLLISLEKNLLEEPKFSIFPQMKKKLVLTDRSHCKICLSLCRKL